MKKGAILAISLFALTLFSGLALAQGEIITGELVAITGEMYTVKTQSKQGFVGSRSTFHVDPKTTEKSGKLEIGMVVQAELDPNGFAYWVKQIEPIINPTR